MYITLRIVDKTYSEKEFVIENIKRSDLFLNEKWKKINKCKHYNKLEKVLKKCIKKSN